MFLKSLTLRGFKSFADRTVLRFENGVTGIVGPNGSGKSNISEAVMWVLGEQSARSLRSGSMEDVIFAGSSSRQALGMAEVILTLSNNDGTLPIEFSEVTITRRLYRSGESDYFINNSPCRLLDIQELLSDSGLGKGLYSIIGQGRLEEILNSKPEEKRILIEEAAGIIKHKKRKERAIRRLASMDQNLQRAKDIALEVSRQLKPLRTQANKAREYNELSSKLRSLEIGLAVMELKDLQEDWENICEYENNLKQELSSLKEEQSALFAETEKLQLEFETKNFYSGDIIEKRRKLQSIEEKIRSSIDLLEEKAKHIEQRINEANRAISQAENRKHDLEDQKKWLDREKRNIADEIGKYKQELDTIEQQISKTSKKRLDSENMLASLKDQLNRETRSNENLKSSISSLQLKIQTNENKLDFLKDEIDSLVAKRIEIFQKLDQKKRDLELIRIELTQLEFQLSDLELTENQLKNELDSRVKQENELKQKQAAVKARIKALEDIIESFPSSEDITESFNTIEMIGILGLIKDSIKVRPEYEKAIEAVLGADLFCVVLENSSILDNLIKNKGSESLSLTSFIPIDKARFKLPNTELPKATWALDVIAYPDALKYAISALLSHVYIVEDFATAASLQEKVENEILVTLDGEVFLPSGKIILGAANEAIGILGYQRELEELNNELDDIAERINNTSISQKEVKNKIEQLLRQKTTLTKKIQAKKIEQSNLNQSIKELEPESSNLSKKEKSLSEQIINLDKLVNEDNDKLALLKQEQKIQNEKIFSIQYRIEDEQKKRENLLEEETKSKVKASKVKAEIKALEERINNLERRLKNIQKELNSFDAQTEADKNFFKHLKSLYAKIPTLKQAYKQILSSIAFRHDQISEMTLFEEGSLEDLRQELRQNQLNLSKLNDLIEANIRKLHEAEVKKAQLELKVTSAVQKVVDEYDVPLEKALDQGLNIPRDEAEQQASELRRRIAALGPINPIAIEEYEQLAQRYNMFNEQIDDLLRGRRALMKVINAIEHKMKESFVETFEKVNEGFQKVFESLFPGGQAELILTNPDDVANSGVDIVAQPGGKKLQRMSLLSGGEKSLVALAFSFALYQTRPSPFYILDEVEAALDDINLQRFIALLKQLKKNSQVLIITHQRRTMEVCDTLYGVSMQADGVSRLISQKFSEVTLV